MRVDDLEVGPNMVRFYLERIAELEAVVRAAHSAISTLDKDELGYVLRDDYLWPIRDELLSKLQNALKP